MKILIEKSKLVQAVDAVMKAVKKKSTSPILEGILIDTTYNGIKLTGTDTKTSIQYRVDCTVVKPGTVVIEAGLFSEIIRSMSDEIDISVNSSLLTTLKSGKTKIDIKGLDAKGFPSMPEITADAKTFEVDQQIFKEMVSRVSFAVVNDIRRPMLAGIYISVYKGNIDLVATDGFHMAIRTTTIQSSDVSVLVDAKTLETVTKAFETGNITVSITDTQVQFKSENIRVAMRTMNRTYVAYNSILPREYATKFKIKPSKLLNSINKAMLLITEPDKKCSPLIIDIKGDSLNLSISTSLGNFDDEIPVDISGKDLKIAFDPKLLTNCLRKIEDDEIEVKFVGENSPVIFQPIEDKNDFLYFALPVRIKDYYG